MASVGWTLRSRRPAPYRDRSRFTSLRRDFASHDVDAESRPWEFLHPTCSNLWEAEHVAYDPMYATFASLDPRW